MLSLVSTFHIQQNSFPPRIYKINLFVEPDIWECWIQGERSNTGGHGETGRGYQVEEYNTGGGYQVEDYSTGGGYQVEEYSKDGGYQVEE